MKELALGIDIGGTNTCFGLVDSEGKCIEAGFIPTQDHDNAEGLANELCHTISNTLEKLGGNHQLIGAGIGAPNGNYYNGTIEFAPNLKWEGIIPLGAIFKERLGLPVCVTNDANAAAIGEMTYGVAKGMNNFIMVTLGTGLGSGFVVNGQLVYGHDGFAGELGHVIVEQDGRECGCGRKGCLEAYVSATGICKTAIELLNAGFEKSIINQSNKDSITSKGIADAAELGDPIALEVFDYTAEKLGLALANAVALTSPEAIILFGGLAQSEDLILEPTRKAMEDNLLKIFKGKIKLLLSGIESSNAAILGAAALAWKETKS